MPHPKSRRDHLRIARTEEGGLAIYDEASDDGHLLNMTTATVYELADGTRSIDALAEQVAARAGAPVEPDLVLFALDELDQAGLLEADDTVPRARIDRRGFLAKFGLGAGIAAGVAALLPVVDTITRVSQAAPDHQFQPPDSTPNPENDK